MEFAEVYDQFFNPGDVTEIRALGLNGKNRAWAGWTRDVVFGYFDNAATFSEAAASLSSTNAAGIYFTPNPVRPELLARASNRLKAASKKNLTTADKDILCLRWLLIDLDPKRPAGISASNEELARALELRNKIGIWFREELGLKYAISAVSGNGAHMMVRLADLDNSPENVAWVRDVLAGLAGKWSTDDVDVDLKVYNPARIWKLYGTMARKGDSTEDRPHRKSYIQTKQEGFSKLSDIPAAPDDFRERLAALKPSDPEKDAGRGIAGVTKSRQAASGGGKKTPGSGRWQDLGALDMGKYLSHYGVAHSVKQARNGATIYALDACIFDPSHGPNESSIMVTPEGAIYYQCFHGSCQGRTWHDARERISGAAKMTPFMDGYSGQTRSAAAPTQKDENHCYAPNFPIIFSGSLEVSGPAVPPPLMIDKWLFFRAGAKGKVFMPSMLAEYLGAYLGKLVCTAKQFWLYDGGIWQELPRTSIFQLGVMALKDLAKPASINSAIDLLEGMVNQEEESWTAHDGFINCKNGMIDLQAVFSGAPIDTILKPHSHTYKSRTQIAAKFEPDQDPDDFLRILQQIFPGKNEAGKIELLQEAFGYALWPSCRYETAFFLYGSGANGKGTLCEALTAMIGDQNVSSLSLEQLQERFKTRFLQDKLINYSSENPERQALETENFKKAVSGEFLMAERKFGEIFQFKPFAKFFFSFNTTPIIQDKSYGFTRRVQLIEFKQRFDGRTADTSIREEKIHEWKDAILNWSLMGLARIKYRGRFYEDETLKKSKEEFLGKLNPALEFVKQETDVGDGHTCMSQELYDAYKLWCDGQGIRKLGQSKFNEQIENNFPQIYKDRDKTTRRFVFRGIRIRPDSIG